MRPVVDDAEDAAADGEDGRIACEDARDETGGDDDGVGLVAVKEAGLEVG